MASDGSQATNSNSPPTNSSILATIDRANATLMHVDAVLHAGMMYKYGHVRQISTEPKRVNPTNWPTKAFQAERGNDVPVGLTQNMFSQLEIGPNETSSQTIHVCYVDHSLCTYTFIYIYIYTYTCVRSNCNMNMSKMTQYMYSTQARCLVYFFSFDVHHILDR